MKPTKPTIADLIRECREIRRWAEERLERSRREAEYLFAEMLAMTVPEHRSKRHTFKTPPRQPIKLGLSEEE